MTFKPTIADIEILEHAAAMLDADALCLRQSSTQPPEHEIWDLEDDAKESYDQMKKSVAELYALADRMRPITRRRP